MPLPARDAVVSAHAQIGGLEPGAFTANNVVATERLIDAASARQGSYLVQISSSVVKSAAIDFYTESKKAQEKIVVESGIPCAVLRPTLMFGWFDRKHLGWLARFMARTPVFPIPGNGRYLRQPLYVGDFCDIIMACIERRITGAYNISGLEAIDYIDLIRAVRETLELKRADRQDPVPAVLGAARAYACSTGIRPSPPSSSRRWSRRTCSRSSTGPASSA